ncbi:MAG: HAD-IIIC family phosphatase, partial [Anaerolineales bacterium]
YDEDLPRAAQLTQKTNQFNLTTRRYTEQELRALQTTPTADVFIVSVADKYGDNGKVFLSIVRRGRA